MKKILTLPVSEEEIRALKVGDIFWLTGTLATGRDDVHRRVCGEGKESPFNFRDMAIYHAGPIVKTSAGGYEIVSVGPTTSMRMEKHAADFIEKTGVRIMIGKGGMGDKTAAACKEYGAVHCVCPGGCAVSGALQIKEVKTVFWSELGMPEAMWVLEAEEFGPLIVSIDAQGRSMLADNREMIASRINAGEKPVLDSVKDF